MELKQQLEAILFFKAEPVSFEFLSRATGAKTSDIKIAAAELAHDLKNRGLRIIITGDTVGIYTAPEAAELLEKITREEIERELSPASLETLSTVAYLGPIAKSEIDYIRGVNCAFTLRALTVRGLVEKIQNSNDARTFMYQPTQEFLAHMGLTSQEQLPGYAETIEAIDQFKSKNAEKQPVNIAAQEVVHEENDNNKES